MRKERPDRFTPARGKKLKKKLLGRCEKPVRSFANDAMGYPRRDPEVEVLERVLSEGAEEK